MTLSIPFLDLVAPHAELREELSAIFESALDSGGFIGGPVVEKFEGEFAGFCGTRNSIGVSSGTDALRFALIAAGVKQGAVVVTVPNTFIATTEAISQAGAMPAFVDVDERTYNMDPAKLRIFLEERCFVNERTGELIERESGRRVMAVVPVHLYGQMADMDPILELAERFRLIVVEDACQAHGAEYFSRREKRWRKAGSMGKAAAFSFYPGKNLGACGEGGAVTTDDATLNQTVRMLRDHGQVRKYIHRVEGYNGRLDAIQAGILSVKLSRLAQWNEQRCERAQIYDELLAEADGAISAPYVPEWARPVYHLYIVRVTERERVQERLTASGIGTGIHYPVPLHLCEAYQDRGFRAGDFPVAERAASEVLSLPMFPTLEMKSQGRVIAELIQATTVKAAAVAAS